MIRIQRMGRRGTKKIVEIIITVTFLTLKKIRIPLTFALQYYNTKTLCSPEQTYPRGSLIHVYSAVFDRVEHTFRFFRSFTRTLNCADSRISVIFRSSTRRIYYTIITCDSSLINVRIATESVGSVYPTRCRGNGTFETCEKNRKLYTKIIHTFDIFPFRTYLHPNAHIIRSSNRVDARLQSKITIAQLSTPGLFHTRLNVTDASVECVFFTTHIFFPDFKSIIVARARYPVVTHRREQR